MRYLTCVAVCVLTGSVLAQEPQSAPPAEQPESSRPGYSGPVILSRGTGPRLGRSGELVRIRPFLQLNGIYDTGLTALSVSPSGEAPDDSAYGGEAGFGVYGYHPWRRSLVGVDYRGSLRHYSREHYYDGFDNFFSLRLVHQPSPHVVVSLAPAAASYSNSGFLPISGSEFYDPGLAGLTANDLFNNRTNVVSVAGRLVYQKTARLSFAMAAEGFAARRRSRALAGVTGYQAGGDVAYRLSRFQTIGLDYLFNHYDFTGLFGSSDAHGLALNYSAQIGRFWTLGLRAGAFRLEVLRLQTVTLDPAIAAIIGQWVALSTFHKIGYIPNLGGDLTRRFRRAALSFNYSRGLFPGNGLYLATATETAGASYNYSGFRRVSLGWAGGYTTARALMQTIGHYKNYYAGFGVSYTLRRSLSLIARVDARRYEILGATFDRTSYRTALGLAYSPGELPFSIW